jgi:hypothetical protein
MPCEKEQRAWQDRSRELAAIVEEIEKLEKHPDTGRPGTPSNMQRVKQLPGLKRTAEGKMNDAKRAYEECMKKAKPKT